MSTNNSEASPTPADERLTFEENLEAQREALAEELADRLIQFRDETGVADLYVVETFVKSALLRARELALKKEKDKLAFYYVSASLRPRCALRGV